MNDKNFTAQVLEALKGKSFEVKKILFNTDDCVSKVDYDDLKLKYEDLREELADAKTLNESFRQREFELTSNVADKLNEISALNRKLDAERANVQHRNVEISRLDGALQDARMENRDLNITVRNQRAQIDYYAENYADLEHAFQAYQKLPDSTKFDLAGVFGNKNSPVTFLAGALQDGHLDSLFDYISAAINNHAPQAEINILRDVFDFAFSVLNNAGREEIYSRILINAGDNFDGEIMQKISDSPQEGSVQEILLVGYKSIRTSAVQKPSLVLLG